MSKVLVTGANGFIGSRLVAALLDQGEHVRALVRPGSSTRALPSPSEASIEIVRGDILCEDDVYRALAGCDRLYHVAAVYRMYAPDPEQVMGPAVRGTTNVMNAVMKRGSAISKVVVTSSVAAIGVNDQPEPMDEDWKFNLQDSETYIVAKWKAERVALEYVEKEGLPVVVVNPAGVFGPGDWKPTPSGQTVLAFLRWKWPWCMPVASGGLNVVDVDDVVQGHLLAMEKGKIGERYILGGEDVTHQHMYDLLARLSGARHRVKPVPRGMAMWAGRAAELAARFSSSEPPFTYKLARDFVGRYVWVSSRKAVQQLGYRHRPAMKTLERSIRWYEDNGYV